MQTKRKISFFMVMLMAICCMAGCGDAKADSDNLIMLEPEYEEATYNLAMVGKMDISKSIKVRCEYQAVNEQDVKFDVEGRRIEKVYVEEGDTVKKGQLLVALTSESTEARIKDINFELEKNRLLWNQTLNDKQDQIDRAQLEFSYTDMWEKDKVALRKKLENIEENYKYTLRNYENQEMLLNMELAQLNKELEGGKLYAELDGTISFIKSRLEGSMTQINEKIMTITDTSECIFVADKNNYASYFSKDVPVGLEIAIGSSAGMYDVVFENEDTYQEGDRMLFALADNRSDVSIDIGTRGTITLVLDTKSQVLSVSQGAVREVDGKYYVYILDENDDKQVKWVKIGLEADGYTEITEGLSEGDRVILR